MERVCRALFFILRCARSTTFRSFVSISLSHTHTHTSTYIYMKSLLLLLMSHLSRSHHNQLLAARVAAPHLETLRGRVRERLRHLKDVVGFNLAGLRTLQQELDLSGEGLIAKRETRETGEAREKKKGRASQRCNAIKVELESRLGSSAKDQMF